MSAWLRFFMPGTCEECGGALGPKNRKYCSRRCYKAALRGVDRTPQDPVKRAAWLSKQSVVQRKPKSAQHRAKHRARWKALSTKEKQEFIARGQRAAKRKTSGTSIEMQVRGVLDKLGVPYRHNVWIGHYCVDILLGGHGVIECDGEYWHSSKAQRAHDAKRDKWLGQHGYTVVRLRGTEIHKTHGAVVLRALSALWYNVVGEEDDNATLPRLR